MVPAIYRMHKLSKSGVAVGGTLCRRVRVRGHSEEVGAERELGGRGQLQFQKWRGLGAGTPGFHPFPSSMH